MTQNRDEGIIELTQVAGEAESGTNGSEVIELTEIDTQDPSRVKDDLVREPAGKADPGDIRLTDDQLEAALERVIEKKFGTAIETLLSEATQRIVTKEIQRIKRSIEDDLRNLGDSG